MRWHFGGNLQPVRMICEYDWKDCPIAVVSYIWSEIVTDVVDGVTGEAHLWRIFAVMVLCSMLFHVYYKMRITDKTEPNFARDDLVKVGFKIQDLELKINVLTYKMQYGNWPMPHEIPTPSLNELRNVKLTLSNTSRKNMWTKHHLHGYISKCIRNSEEDKWMKKEQPQGDNLLSEFRDSGNKDLQTPKFPRNLKLPSGERDCKDYELLIRTTDECRKYMDEINESNRSLGLFNNSTDFSDNQNSSEETSHRFLVDPKKWHEIYKSNDRGEGETSDSDLNASVPNFKHKDSAFTGDDEQRHPLKSSKNKSRFLPPGLSITFLSDKFRALTTSDNCVKPSTNETLNRVKEKLESLHDIKNSGLINNVGQNLDNKFKMTELSYTKILDKLMSSDGEDSGADFNRNQKGIEVVEEKKENSPNECKDPQNLCNTSGNVARTKEMPEISSLLRRDLNESVSNIEEHLINSDARRLEKNINLNFVLSPRDKSAHQPPMETDDDLQLVSGTSSRTEWSKDSDTDEKSTTTLLREALGFKKALLMQIQDKESEDKSECDSDDTFRSKTDNTFRSKLLDIISEEQSAGSSTEKTSRTYILSRTINETNLCEESERKNLKRDDNLKSDVILRDEPYCGDCKCVVRTISSEYFSTHNIVDNEHQSAQKVDNCVADGDGLRELELNDVENRGNVKINEGSKVELKKGQAEDEQKSKSIGSSVESRDAFERQIEIETNEKIGSVVDNIQNEASKLRFFKSLTSMISDKAMSWNSISESSSEESIAQFVNALTNMESKNVYAIAEEKLMMFSSTDYEGRNFARAGEDDSVRPEKQEKNKEGSSNQLKSHSVLKLDQERLHRKQEILSKLKSLDAFTKPIDISECNSEKIEDEDSTPLTGRTVVCICRSDSKTVNHTIGDVLKDKVYSCVPQQKASEENDFADQDAKKNLESKKMVVNSKKKNLSKSSITNFSTDTSDSYFDVSNHDFAVSSIILTSQNSNFVGNQKADPSKSDTSSSYVDASDRSISKIASDSNSMEHKELSKLESSTKTQLIPKVTSSLPSDVKKPVAKSQSEQNQPSRSSNHDTSKCWSSLNLDKSNSTAKTASKSFIPVLKSRVDIPRRGKSVESKARSRSPMLRSNTPRIQSARSNFNCQTGEREDEKRVCRQSNPCESKKSLNRKESYTLSSKNSETREERPIPKPDSADKRKNKIVESVSNVSEKSDPSKPGTGHLTKECTVIYINIIADTEGNESQSPEGREITKRVNRDDKNRQSLSLGDIKSDRPEGRECGMDLASPPSDCELCKELSNGVKNGNEKSRSLLEAGGKDLDGISAPTANKLLSTSTLELSRPVRVERREMEVSVKPSVKNTSTSVSGFPDSSLAAKRSFYNPNIEMFDESKDLVQRDKIILSEMLGTTTDPNFFECKKAHRLYNKLGLGFREQSEQL